MGGSDEATTALGEREVGEARAHADGKRRDGSCVTGGAG